MSPSTSFRLLNRFLKGSAVVAMLSMSMLASAQRVPKVEFPPMPQLQLPVNKARGSEAIRHLGDQLPDVARAHGMSADQLQRQLLQDQTLWIDRKGRLFYIEEPPSRGNPPPAGPASKGPTSGATAAGATTASALPLTDPNTFLLHSRPGAKRTIYLDFNGHTVTGTAWNSSYSIGTLTTPAFDLDGFPDTFNSTELGVIRGIWQRVAEDYAPFDVDITTEEPLSADTLLRSTSADDIYGSRVVITKDFTKATTSPCGCGGFAYVGVFGMVNNSYYQPAYVFYDQLASAEKYIAEAVSHEAGHNVGLSHDGTSTTGYYSGQGTGATGWAPIMGVGYYKELVQWSKGEYLDANNKQDDFVVMQQNGAPLRVDDHGGTPATATTMASAAITTNAVITGQSLSAAGVIETASDVDVFSFATTAGTLNLTLTGAAPSPNLDAQVKLLNASGGLITTVNPVDALNATLTATLAAGQYYITVEGVGKGDPTTTGYSDYGSLGQYQITGTAPPSPGSAPVASLSATPNTGVAPLPVTFNGSATDQNGTITLLTLDYGDGSTATTAASASLSASHTYSTPGTYTARLTATDDQNLSGQTSVQIVVSSPLVSAYVSDITTALKINRTQAIASATVYVMGSNGQKLSGLTVNGSWSGAVSGNVSGTTGTGGTVTFSNTLKSRGTTATFTVNSITGTGYVYNAALNKKTSASFTY